MRMPQLMICAEVRLRDPPQPAGQLRAAGDPPRLQQAAGPVAVPQLVEQERAARLAARGGQHGRRRPSWPSASPAPPPSPAGRPPSATACASCSTTSRIRPTTRPASPSSAHQECGKTGNDKTPSCSACRTTPARWSTSLDVFKQNKINLTWIESFPARSAEAGVYLLRRFRGPRRGPQGRNVPSTTLQEHCEAAVGPRLLSDGRRSAG